MLLPLSRRVACGGEAPACFPSEHVGGPPSARPTCSALPFYPFPFRCRTAIRSHVGRSSPHMLRTGPARAPRMFRTCVRPARGPPGAAASHPPRAPLAS
eukprot:2355796-Pleurochrysis_carterae.AAC.1